MTVPIYNNCERCHTKISTDRYLCERCVILVDNEKRAAEARAKLRPHDDGLDEIGDVWVRHELRYDDEPIEERSFTVENIGGREDELLLNDGEWYDDYMLMDELLVREPKGKPPEIGRCDCGASVRMGVGGASRQCDACWGRLMNAIGKEDSRADESESNVVPIRPPMALGEFMVKNPGECWALGFFPMRDGETSVVLDDMNGETLATERLPAKVRPEAKAAMACAMVRKAIIGERDVRSEGRQPHPDTDWQSVFLEEREHCNKQRAEINRLDAKVRKLEADVLAAERELERHRHGQTIEGDHVCPNELAYTNVMGELKRIVEEAGEG